MLPDIWEDNCAAFCEDWGVSWERWDREPQPWSLPASKTVRDHKRPQRVIFHLKNKGVIFKSKISQLFQNSSQQKAPCAPKQQEQPTGAAQPKELLSSRHTRNSCGTWALPFSRTHQRLGDFHKPGSLVLLSVRITRGNFNTRLNSREVWLHATGPSDTSLTHHTHNNAIGKSSSQRAGAMWGPNCSKPPTTPTWAKSWGQKGSQRQTLQWPPTHHV